MRVTPLKQTPVKNAEMLKYARDWATWYESDRKRTAELFRDTLLKMDEQNLFDLNEYNQLIDCSSERDETRTDAKKMARVLAKSWVWDRDEEELDKFNRRVDLYRKSMPIRNGERLKKAGKDEGVRF